MKMELNHEKTMKIQICQQQKHENRDLRRAKLKIVNIFRMQNMKFINVIVQFGLK